MGCHDSMNLDIHIKYLLIWVLLNVAIPAFAQCTVSGTVKEKDTGLGAVGVNVLLRSQPRSGMLGFGAVASSQGMWTPGMINGKPVSTSVTMPISFRR